MKKQADETKAGTSSPRIIPRFGLRLIFGLLTVIAVGMAWLLQPQFTTGVTFDATKMEAAAAQRAKRLAAQGVQLCMPGTPREDHCIRIRTPRIINDALEASEDLKAFAEGKSAKPVEWIYNHIEAVPVGDYRIRVMAIGDASDARELQHLVEALSNAYRGFLLDGTSSSKPLIEIKPEKTGWRVQWRFAR